VNVSYRRALVGDASAIKGLIDQHTEDGPLIPRPLIEICETIRDFWVAESDEGIAACCSMHVDWMDLGEVRSLVVRPDFRGKGVGRELVSRCVEDAKAVGLARVFALTAKPEFFHALGFADIDKAELPHKVWSDCVRCLRFPDCCEVAVIRDA